MTAYTAVTAHITDTYRAPAIRRALRLAGLGYNTRRRQWETYCPTGTRGVRLVVQKLQPITGITYRTLTPAEWKNQL